MSNTALWDKLGKTDPAHTKGFKRAGGFTGTAIKPMFSYRRMTEEFGPCGTGWGVSEPSFQVVPAGEEILVYCTVSIWWDKPQNVVFGVGGDKVATKGQNGVRTDDEAFKKAFTDAVTNALKLIGVGADVHMGMFDDSKYVNTVANEFKTEKAANDTPKPSAAHQKRELEQVKQDLVDATTVERARTVFKVWREIAQRDGWSKDYWQAAADMINAKAQELKAQEDTVSDIQDEFPGSRVVNEHVRQDEFKQAGE